MVQVPFPAKRILVVDDEPFVCDCLAMVLRFEGHTVATANSAQTALELFAPGKFDLVVTDYFMPGMTGEELAATLKARAPQLPILMVSAYADGLRSQGRGLSHVDGLLSKPFEVGALRQAIAAVFLQA